MDSSGATYCFARETAAQALFYLSHQEQLAARNPAWPEVRAFPVIAFLIPLTTKPRPDPDLARGVWAEGDALPPAASSDLGNGAGRLCSAPGLV